MDEELCVVVTLPSPLEASRVCSRLPALWNAHVEGCDVVVVAADDAQAAEIESILAAAVAKVVPPAAEESTKGSPTPVADGIVELGFRFLDHL